MTESIKLVDFEALIEEYALLEGELEDLKRDVFKPKQDRLMELEGKILQTLEDHEMKSYRSKHGLVTRNIRYTVPTPKTLEDKTAFFDWLNKSKGREVYWNYVTVNSQSLNSFVKAEMDAAKEAGDLDFKIPGLMEAKPTPYLSRRGK